jgi:2'-5' RNA ligase
MTSHQEATGLSLWLVPEGEIHRRLAARIGELSRRFGTPPFDPHVTLLPGIEMDDDTARLRTGELAARLGPIRVQLTTAGQEDEYFRSVFIDVDPGPELLEARRLSTRVFGIERAAPFRPHLSLLYGDLKEEQRRHAVGSVAEGGVAFLVRRLELVRTAGRVEEWRRLAAPALSGP